MNRPSRAERRGAYGLRLHAPLDTPSLDTATLVAAADTWPDVEIVRRRDAPVQLSSGIDDRRAWFNLGGGRRLEIDAHRQRATFTAGTAISDADLVHPLLAPVGAAFAWWAGREAIHAGAFMHGEHAFAVVGGKGQGKSTLLAWLHRHGHDIVADDMLVIDGLRVFAGPRCIDLRQVAAERLELGQLTVRTPEPRWRVTLRAAPSDVTMGAWVFLRWGNRLEVTRVPPAALLPWLARHRSMLIPPRDPTRLLELAGLPAFEVVMPTDWDMLPRVASEVVSVARCQAS